MNQGLLPASASFRHQAEHFWTWSPHWFSVIGWRVTGDTLWRNRIVWMDCPAPISSKTHQQWTVLKTLRLQVIRDPTLPMADIFPLGSQAIYKCIFFRITMCAFRIVFLMWKPGIHLPPSWNHGDLHHRGGHRRPKKCGLENLLNSEGYNL